jgi:hypothetical protein
LDRFCTGAPARQLRSVYRHESLLALAAALEPQEWQLTSVVEVFIDASVERLWAALTEAADTEQYFMRSRVTVGDVGEGYSKGGLIEIEKTLDTPARCGVIAHEIGHLC